MQAIKYFVIILLIGVVILTAIVAFSSLSNPQETKEKPQESLKKDKPKGPSLEVPQNMSVEEKKERYYALVNPVIQKVYSELMQQYREVKKDMISGKNRKKTQELKERYKVTTDKELLLALKPHPPSIALAQGAMESSWATSRFFVKGKNIFGMWSINPNEPRIAAGKKREGNRTIWLRKFETLEDSVHAYYRTIGRANAYKEFRKARYETDNPFKMIGKLDKYAEIGEEYPKELGSMIRYNELVKYDK